MDIITITITNKAYPARHNTLQVELLDGWQYTDEGLYVILHEVREKWGLRKARFINDAWDMMVAVDEIVLETRRPECEGGVDAKEYRKLERRAIPDYTDYYTMTREGYTEYTIQ